jgi:NAD(P)-dependent dehydrogenase (short-subunit alcohol dehydrogenase family)
VERKWRKGGFSILSQIFDPYSLDLSNVSLQSQSAALLALTTILLFLFISQASLSDDGVRVNCICPHAVFTEMILLQMEALKEGRREIPERFANMTPEEILGMFAQ